MKIFGCHNCQKPFTEREYEMRVAKFHRSLCGDCENLAQMHEKPKGHVSTAVYLCPSHGYDYRIRCVACQTQYKEYLEEISRRAGYPSQILGPMASAESVGASPLLKKDDSADSQRIKEEFGYMGTDFN